MEILELTVDDRTVSAGIAWPDGDGPWPGVVIIHDIYGYRGDTERHIRRFVEAGYAAIAPALYAGSAGCVVKTLVSMVTEKGWGLHVVEAARARLVEDPRVDADGVGVTGFCMGGGFALLAAADGAFAVAAPFYGAVPRTSERLEGICPTIGQFGGEDLVFRGQAARLSRHLRELGVPHEVLVYDEAGHSFMNDHPMLSFRLGRYTPLRGRYEPDVEARAWEALLGFFEAHLEDDVG